MGAPRTLPPERTCIGCRRKGWKPDLVRIVRLPDGTVAVDRGGRAEGRGAYVHRDAECIRRAARRGAFGRALRTALEPNETVRLVDELQTGLGDEA